MNIQHRTRNNQFPVTTMKIISILVICLVYTFKINAQESIKIGSKLFTESVILGEITSQFFEVNGINTEYYDQLGGTRILWNALQETEIDLYPEYTGTIIQEILKGKEIRSFEELRFELQSYGVGITNSLGFNNTYALGMKKDNAKTLDLNRISDLDKHTGLSYGFSNEFIDRNDGWKGLREFYSINTKKVTGLDHDLAYRGLEAGNIDVIDCLEPNS